MYVLVVGRSYFDHLKLHQYTAIQLRLGYVIVNVYKNATFRSIFGIMKANLCDSLIDGINLNVVKDVDELEMNVASHCNMYLIAWTINQTFFLETL